MQLRLPIEQIDEGGLEQAMEPEASGFPVLEEIRKRGEAAFQNPIHFEFRAVRAGEYIDVRGRFTARVRLRCSRCLSDFHLDLAERFALTYCPRPLMPEQVRPGEEAELSEDEIDLIPFDGDEIDLLEGFQEQLVMSLPVKALCAPECRGICPQCGADLNQGPCGCVDDRIDPRLAVLAKFKPK
jgi:uncharacterized protein